MDKNSFPVPEIRAAIGGFYSDSSIEKSFVEKLNMAKDFDVLNGLHPDGFHGDAPCDIHEFDLMKVAELCETVSNYFVVSEEFDSGSSIDDIYTLLKVLHSAPESLCKGGFGIGYTFLVLWVCMYSWERDIDAGGGFITDVNSDAAWDPAQYMDNSHGFENLLRPVTWNAK